MKAQKVLYPQYPVLIIDDEEVVLNYISSMLQLNGINNIITCQDARKACEIIRNQEIELVLLDLSIPHISGEEVLGEICRDYPDIPVIIVTGINDVEMAVKCMRTGAVDYMVKPVEHKRLVSGVLRTIELRELRRENDLLKSHVLSPKVEHPEAFSKILTCNGKMLSIFQYIEAIATSQQPVLITGESGVGKELIARSIHVLSGLDGHFIAVNVAGLDDNMFSDTLFGHERGAFTGADTARKGLIEQASGGTLFLDEIGDLTTPSQTKLLRLMQEKEYYALGSDDVKMSDARIVVSTNRNLHTLQQKGGFRKDLYYRLRIHHVEIPPLRKRLDDIPLLIDHFLSEAAKSLGKKKPDPPGQLYSLLRSYSFPGNVRELQSLIFDALSRSKGSTLSIESFRSLPIEAPKEELEPHDRSKSEKALLLSFSGSRLPTLKEASLILIREALQRSGQNQTKAARLLGISQQALSKRLKQ